MRRAAIPKVERRARKRPRAAARASGNPGARVGPGGRTRAATDARALLGALPDLVLTLDRQGTILSTNRGGVAGAPRPGGSLYDWLALADRDAARAALAQVLGGGPPVRFECRGLEPGGAWHECRVAPLGRRGKPVSAVMIASDISGRQRAGLAVASAYRELDARVRERTRALRTASEKLQQQDGERLQAQQLLTAIFANEPECVKLLGPDGRFQTINPAGLALLQADGPEQIVGRVACELVTAAHRDAFIRAHQAAFRGDSGRLEFEAESLKGRRLWLELRFVPLRDMSGHVVSALGITRDLTERRRAEVERAAIEERYRALVENMPGTTYLSAADRGASPQFVSRQMHELTGFTPEECIADPDLWAKQMHPEDRERVLGEWAEAISSGRSFRSKYRWRTKDGRLVWWRDEAHPVHDAAGRILYHGLFVDVTAEEAEAEARARTEERLSRNLGRLQRLFELTAAVNREAGAGAVHELALDALAHGLGLERVAMRMCDAGGAMRHVATRGLSEACRSAAVGHSPWHRSVRDPEPVVVADTATARLPGAVREAVVREGIGALTFVPIFKERLLGEFVLYYRSPYAPDAEELQFALTVARQIALATERVRAERALSESHDRLRRLAEHLQRAREDERARIAREVHDELGQTLTAMKLDLAWLKGRLQRQPELAGRVTEASALADTAIQSVRRISTALRPVVLDDLGLAPAVEWLAHDLEARSGIRFRLGPPFEDLRAGGELSTHVFRLFQEALTNVVRHSGATEAAITLGRRGESVHGGVRDNGRGIPAQRLGDPQALGLLSMRERVRLLGGELSIGASAAGGTVVEFRCPFRAAGARSGGS